MYKKLLIAYLLFFTFSVNALNKEDMSAVESTVKNLCQISDGGTSESIQVGGEGDVKVRVGALGLGSVKGSVDFTKREWNGVQQVLREHQAQDSKDYRACVRSLTPIFLEKYKPEPIVKTYNIKVKTFPTRANQVSGVTLELYVNDDYIDEISNLRGTQRVTIGELPKGEHEFIFANVNGYFVDGFGNYQRHPQFSDMECNGEFYVNRNKTYQLQVYVDNFGNLRCGLE
ncbi:hypothetical protein [Vibrio sp. EJY3]|uniref:hypothetical protein n=1 Tax=Vibrio sp. (strain EJY3) TaxID=1116375 RepID=UPI000243BEA0|nr:hypothetical protein [Vibrio sp. EJY3]AEX22254.1 hypothetical protein VEJY3_08830 [Vibrio sp. EJY3]